MNVFVAMYSNHHGISCRAFNSFAKAQGWKNGIGVDNWKSVSNDPVPTDECGDEYFNLAFGEYFDIEECVVE